MCGIFGFSSYGNALSQKDATSLITSLSIASAERGIHATGVAYLQKGKIEITKAPKAAYDFKFSLPKDVSAVIGHTRHATQGDYKKNINNHPFDGKAGNHSFALAHNGIISNDEELRESQNLSKTKIETDSYIAVQLLNNNNEVNLGSIKAMAELIEGSYTFSILDNQRNLYLVKGNNPIAIIHDKKLKLYIYASTEEILWQGIVGSDIFKNFKNNLISKSNKIEEIKISEGDILKISTDGLLTYENFKVKESYGIFNLKKFGNYRFSSFYDEVYAYNDIEIEYIEELKSTASYLGYDTELIDTMLYEGYQFEEIEEILYTHV